MVSDDGSAGGGAQDTRPLAESAPPPTPETSPAPTAPLRDPAVDPSDDDIAEVHIDAAPNPSSGTGQDRDAEPVGDDYEEDEEEDDDEEEETDGGGEEIVDAMRHWTDEVAEAAVIEVRKWIA